MNKKPDKFQFDIEFTIPESWILDIARKSVKSSNEQMRVLSKALLDFTAVTTNTKDNMVNDRPTDLGPYLDFWFADAIEVAIACRDSKDSDLKVLADCLIHQESSVLLSKESVLKEMKRTGLDNKKR